MLAKLICAFIAFVVMGFFFLIMGALPAGAWSVVTAICVVMMYNNLVSKIDNRK